MSSSTEAQLEALRALARASRVVERASSELSLAHYRVLAAIAAGDERASRLAVRLAIGKPTVSAAVDSLSQRGLITRGGVAGDQRAAALALTAAGQAVLNRVEEAMLSRLSELFERVPDADNLIHCLGLLGTALDEAAEERVCAQQAARPTDEGLPQEAMFSERASQGAARGAEIL